MKKFLLRVKFLGRCFDLVSEIIVSYIMLLLHEYGYLKNKPEGGESENF